MGFIRCFGLLNAAVWFGSGIFFTFAVAPAVFSHDMQGLLGGNNYPYFSGAIAQIIFRRFFFNIQLTCAILAMVHVLCERLYFGRWPEGWRIPLLVFLVIMTFLGGFLVRPKLEKLHTIKYAANSTPAMREAAQHSFGAWHGASQLSNVFVLVGLGIYVCKVSRKDD